MIPDTSRGGGIQGGRIEEGSWFREFWKEEENTSIRWGCFCLISLWSWTVVLNVWSWPSKRSGITLKDLKSKWKHALINREWNIILGVWRFPTSLGMDLYNGSSNFIFVYCLFLYQDLILTWFGIFTITLYCEMEEISPFFRCKDETLAMTCR